MSFNWTRFSCVCTLLAALILCPSAAHSQSSNPVKPSAPGSSPAQRAEAERLIAESRRLGRTPQGVQKLQQALKIYQQLGDRRDAAQVLLEISALYFALFQDDQAIAAAQQAIAQTEPLKDPLETRRARRFLIDLYGQLDQWDAAIATQKQIVAAAEKQSVRDQSLALQELGLLYRQARQDQNAIAAYQRSLKIAETIPLENPSLDSTSDKIGILKDLVNLYTALKQPEQAQAAQQRLILEVQAYALYKEISAFGLRPTDGPAEQILLQTSAGLYQQLGDTRSQAEVLLRLGQVQASLKSPSEALTTLKAALALLNPATNDTLQDQILASLGRLYQNQKQYPEAIATYERQATLARARQDYRAYRTAVRELISLYMDSGQVAQGQVWQERLATTPVVLNQDPSEASIRYFPPLPLLFRTPRGTTSGGNGTPILPTLPPPLSLPPMVLPQVPPRRPIPLPVPATNPLPSQPIAPR